MSGGDWTTPPQLPACGIWSHAVGRLGAAAQREVVQELEELGVEMLWYPEAVGGKESMATGALLLSWTRSLRTGSGIASVYSRDATAAANGARALADAFPGRFVLGLGISHAPQVAARGHAYGPPLAAMAAYLDAMDAAPYDGPPLAAPPARLLAALNPRMLRLAAERSAGVHTYFMPPEHTAKARAVLGPAPALAVEVGFALDGRLGVAEHVAGHLPRDNYRRALLYAGFTEEDVAGGGSSRLVERVAVQGSVADVVARVREHLDAGASHVCVQALGPDRGDPELEQLRELAPALRELAAAGAPA